MIRACRDFLLENAPNWGFGRDSKWSYLVYNNYQPHCSNMNLLWFAEGDRFPRVVTKVFHDPGLPSREFRNQSHAWSHAPQCVARPLHFGQHENRFWTLWMEGVPGYPFQPHSSDYSPFLSSMVDTVAGLHASLVQPSGPERYLRMVAEPLQTVAGFGSSAAVLAGCEETLRTCSDEWLSALPSIPQHGDLFLSNMLSHNGRCYLLDWETFGQADLPFYDVVTLVFSWLRAGGETPDDWNKQLRARIPDLIRRYADALNLRSDIVKPLLPLILANWFHLQWLDGRVEFTRLMYRSITNFFERRELWESTFVPHSRAV